MATAGEVRAAIADVVCAALPPAALGAVVLRPHQRQTVARGLRALRIDGGCLIAEDVGQGKTYVALALARQWRAPLVVVPSALREPWARAMKLSGVSADLVTHEALSRGTLRSYAPDGVVVDESHHFRNPATRRYAALAHMAAFAPVVLLTATPLQNRSRDVAAQVALFLGEAAFLLDDAALSRHVIRGGSVQTGDTDERPRMERPRWMSVAADDVAVLEAILALPAPARPVDAGDAPALRTIALVRAWASSRLALRTTLRHRARLTTAMGQCAEAGRSLTRRESLSWRGEEDVVQLGMVALLAQGTAARAASEEIQRQVADEHAAMTTLSARLRETTDPDIARADAIRRIRAAHPGERVIAFSEFASTVTSMFTSMHDDAHVGMLTSSSARIASGHVPRGELLARFAPVAQHAPHLRAHEQVTLLLTTDLLSEGVNLQDASVVIHLDLPWNPARLAQRIGRVRRPGGSAVACSYVMSPPAPAATLLRTEARLRQKMHLASRTIAADEAVLPALPALSARSADALLELAARETGHSTSAETEGFLLSAMQSWQPGRARASPATVPLVAAVAAPLDGWLAAFSDGRLTGSGHHVTGDSVALLLQLAAAADGCTVELTAERRLTAFDAAMRWHAREDLSRLCGLGAPRGPVVTRIERMTARLCAGMRRHRAPEALVLTRRLRDAMRRGHSLGAEQSIAARLARSDAEAEPLAALRDAACLAERAAAVRQSAGEAGAELVALLVLQRGDDG